MAGICMTPGLATVIGFSTNEAKLDEKHRRGAEGGCCRRRPAGGLTALPTMPWVARPCSHSATAAHPPEVAAAMREARL